MRRFPPLHLSLLRVSSGSCIPVPADGLTSLGPGLDMLWPGQQEMDDENEDKNANEQSNASCQNCPPLVPHKVDRVVHVAGGEQIGQPVQSSCRNKYDAVYCKIMVSVSKTTGCIRNFWALFLLRLHYITITFTVHLEAVVEEITVASEVVAGSSDWQLLASSSGHQRAVHGCHGDGGDTLAVLIQLATQMTLLLLGHAGALGGIQNHTE